MVPFGGWDMPVEYSGLISEHMAVRKAAGDVKYVVCNADESEPGSFKDRYLMEYDPHALITFFQKLQKMEGDVPSFSKYLSDHPATADRITHLQQVIAEKKLGGKDLGAERLRPIKERLGVKSSARADRPAWRSCWSANIRQARPTSARNSRRRAKPGWRASSTGFQRMSPSPISSLWLSA